MLNKIKEDITNILIPRIIKKYPNYSHLFNDEIEYHINPTGKFVIGGSSWRYWINWKKNYCRYIWW